MLPRLNGAPAPRTLAAATMLALVMGLAACGSTPKDEANTQQAIDKLYEDARADMAAGSFERAARTLETVENRAAGTLLSQQAQLDRAYVLWRQQERAQAISVLDRFIRLNPSSPGMPYALYLKGLSNFNENLGALSWLSRQSLSERDQQASRDAYLTFKQLVEQYPESTYAADARLRMDYIVNALADYEVHVARYYLKRGAYVAASNRAQQAITDFPQSPASEEALHILTVCYDRLGLDKLRDDTRRVLAQNFPQSRYLTGELTVDDTPWWQFW